MTSLDERLFNATVGTLELFGVYLGTRLGLYRTLAARGPSRAADLAPAAGIAERYAHEWLEQQAVAGMVTVDDAGLPAEERSYQLPNEHVGVLVDPDDAAHVAPFASMIVGIAGALDEVVDAYRSGAGVPYALYGRSFRDGQGGINRPAFTTDLVESWLPAVADMHDRLRRPGGRIADVGCGQGWSTIALAQAYPQAEVIGYDLDAPSISDARNNAEASGVIVSFERADASAVRRDGPFDAVLLLETLHDLARPVEVLTACRDGLRPGGAVLVADENVAPTFVAPGDELERMMYGWSISHCLPAAMAEQPSAAIGTAIREDTVRELASQAGFKNVEVVDVDAGFFRVYRLNL